jgi:hypothetical protein
LRTTRYNKKYDKKNTTAAAAAGMIAESADSHLIVVDPEKVRVARDKIFEIAKIKVESAYNPIKYEYIEADKMNVIDPSRDKKNKKKQVQDDDEDIDIY